MIDKCKCFGGWLLLWKFWCGGMAVLWLIVVLIPLFGYICESSHGSQIVDQKLFESIESIFDLSPISQISDLICGAASSLWKRMDNTS